MNYLWDYDKNDLKQTGAGRIKILERMTNYDPDKGEKINLTEVRKNWDKLSLYRLQKRLLELILWEHYQPSPKSNK